jgi:hypothetical protein
MYFNEFNESICNDCRYFAFVPRWSNHSRSARLIVQLRLLSSSAATLSSPVLTSWSRRTVTGSVFFVIRLGMPKR